MLFYLLVPFKSYDSKRNKDDSFAIFVIALWGFEASFYKHESYDDVLSITHVKRNVIENTKFISYCMTFVDEYISGVGLNAIHCTTLDNVAINWSFLVAIMSRTAASQSLKDARFRYCQRQDMSWAWYDIIIQKVRPGQPSFPIQNQGLLYWIQLRQWFFNTLKRISIYDIKFNPTWR